MSKSDTSSCTHDVCGHLKLFGQALVDYFSGEVNLPLVLERDDGFVVEYDMHEFFTTEFTKLERLALECCKGRTLDAGAGTGRHSLALLFSNAPEQPPRKVVSIDILPAAVGIMIQRGVPDPRCCNIFEFCPDEPFQTVIMLGNSIGMVGTLERLRELLFHLRANVIDCNHGQLLFDCSNPEKECSDQHTQYRKRNKEIGRYEGENQLRFCYKNMYGPWFNWLYIGEATLVEQAQQTGWNVEILARTGGDYLALLTPRQLEG